MDLERSPRSWFLDDDLQVLISPSSRASYAGIEEGLAIANDLTGNPWVVDTASATPITTDDVFLDTIRWVGATTAGHQAIVKDNKTSPATVYEGLANGANFIDERSFGAEYAGPRRVVGGLAVTTLGSGKLYIYLA